MMISVPLSNISIKKSQQLIVLVDQESSMVCALAWLKN